MLASGGHINNDVLPAHTPTHATAAVRALQDCCAMTAAVAAVADPGLRMQMSEGSTDVGRDWATLHGKMRAALSEPEQERLRPMFEQVRRFL